MFLLKLIKQKRMFCKMQNLDSLGSLRFFRFENHFSQTRVYAILTPHYPFIWSCGVDLGETHISICHYWVDRLSKVTSFSQIVSVFPTFPIQ